jgi:hypothetical protein
MRAHSPPLATGKRANQKKASGRQAMGKVFWKRMRKKLRAGELIVAASKLPKTRSLDIIRQIARIRFVVI